MTHEQKKFFNEVIKPKLIQLTIDSELPSDMNELHYHHFEEGAKQYNINNYQNVRVERAGHYLCEVDDVSIADQLKLIDKQAEIDGEMTLDYVEGVTVWEKVEYSFSVKSFLEEID